MILNLKNKPTEKEILNESLTKNINIINNTCYYGDNYILLQNLLKNNIKFKSIYIDPPFAKNQIFKDKNNNFAYSDNLDNQEFLLFLYKRIIFAKNLLTDDGFFSIHIDQKIGHYVKIICDEIFGFNNFVVDIITSRIKKNHNNNNFNIANDNLLLYKKSDKSILNPIFKESNKKDYWHAFDAKGPGDAKLFNGKLISPPPGNHWRWSQDKIDIALKKGNLRINSKGKPEYLVSVQKQKIDSNWTDISGYSFSTGYPTEKNPEILKRIILATTQENDNFLDFFAGSGTSVQASRELKRNFIVCDKGELSINTIQKRFPNINIIKF